MTKRIFALMLMFAFVLSMCPMRADATEIVASGQCGDSLTWNFAKSGKLLISGSGDMWDFIPYDTNRVWVSGYDEEMSPAPWKDYYASISSIEISPGVTYIGNHAFWSLTALKSVLLPEGITSIGYDVFSYSELTEVTIPASMEYMDFCFNPCSSLSKITFMGDAPSCSDYLLDSCAQGMKILYRSSCSGWNAAKANWSLPLNAQWFDMDSAISPELFEMEHAEVTINPGESMQLTTNADAYTQLLLNWHAEDNKTVYLSKNGVVVGIRPGSATVTVSSEDGTYQNSCLVTVADAPIPNSGIYHPEGSLGYNISYNNYTTWDEVSRSYLTETVDGELEAISDQSSAGIALNRYSRDLALLEKVMLPAELPDFGAFFSGESYNFLVYGQSNHKESDDVEVLRIVKYSKDWNRMDECSIYGANTTIPFRAGTADLAEMDGKLYLHTCHQMYKSSDGLNHQANMTFVINQESMEVADSWYEVMNIGYGYCSHSFSQRVRTNSQYVFRVDHGDAHPRAICLTRANVNGEITDVVFRNLLDIQGESGANATGVSLGGFELSTDNCLIVGNSVDQSSPETYSPSGVRNIFLCVADQELEGNTTYWLTNYGKYSNRTVRTPQIVKVADDLFMVLWEEHERAFQCTYMLMVDGDGTPLCAPQATDVRLSDCQPIVTDEGLVTWFTADGNDKFLYQISWRELLENVATSCTFTDVSLTDYYYKPVIWAVENGITNGYGSPFTFCPNVVCNRGQVVTFLWRAAGEPEPSSSVNPFTDIKESDYFYKAVLWAVEKGITAGYGSADIFNPNGNCTRGQVATFLWRYFGEPAVANSNNPFADVANGAFYYDAVLWAVEQGITNGYGNDYTFAPDLECNRGQVVTFLYRAMN